MEIEGVIFDLDDTLFDCTGQLTGPARVRASKAMRAAYPKLDIDALCRAQETLVETFSSSQALRELGARHGLSDAVIQQALQAYNTEIVEPIAPFPDAQHVLAELRRRGYLLALVTSGLPARQRRKVRQLGFDKYFSTSRGTLFLHDDRRDADKTPFLIEAAAKMRLPHGAVLAIGDKLDAEIAAANALGMQTAHLRHGRQKNRAPQTPLEHPHFNLQTLSDLLDILP